MTTSSYSYDGLRRLIRDADSEGVWTEYTFDRVGNRLMLNTNDDSLSLRPFDEKTVYYSYSDANRLLSLVGKTHPGSPGVKQEENVGQTIYAFRHEVAAQRGNHIHEFAADNLLLMADSLIAELEGHPTPDEGEVAAAIEAIRAQVQADWDGGLISSDGIANSLLVKLDLGDSANSNGANDEWQTQTYSYDANGNRINTEYPGPQGPRVQSTDYSYNPENRLIVHWDYQMNLQGNRVDRAITTMEYDGGGRRLVKAYDPNAGGGGEKRVEYVFDGWDPVAEYNQLNPQYENFYRGDMNRIMTMHHSPSGTAGQMYWYHYDGLGSVSGLTKQHGQSHHNYRYEAYGQIEMPPGNFTDPHNHYTFTGQEWDENMGLYEFYARDYDPVTAVWLSQDTYRGNIRVPLSFNRATYILNNPTNWADIYGFVDEETAKNIIKDNAQYIKDAAEIFDIDPNIVAGVIYQEQTQNVDWKDSAFDKIGFAINTSVGIGQVRISTAQFLADENIIMNIDELEDAGMEFRYGFGLPPIGMPDSLKWATILEDPQLNVQIVAAYIRYFIDEWDGEDECPNIANMPNILGTLYNLGHETTSPNPNPSSNDFGNGVQDNYDLMEELLNE